MAEVQGHRLALARELLADDDRDELEFFTEYVKAAEHPSSIGRLGPEFGHDTVASLGPTLVAIGLHLFDALQPWLADLPKKVAQGFIVDQAKERLKAWFATPKKKELGTLVTDKGRAEILGIVAKLTAQAKLPPKEAEKVTKKVAGYLFESAHG